MKIAVIAANGRSGRLFVKQALANGHSVQAGVHHTNNLKPHKRLTVITCDANNPSDLTKLLQGQDAVISFIGHVKGSPPNLQTDSMRNLTKVMKKMGLRRVISLTGTGVRLPEDKITLVDRLLNFSISHIDPARITDGINHLEVLRQSKLDWTVIRVLKLQNTKAQPYMLRAHGPTKAYVSREEVAQAAIQLLQDRSFVKQAPIISKTKKIMHPANARILSSENPA